MTAEIKKQIEYYELKEKQYLREAETGENPLLKVQFLLLQTIYGEFKDLLTLLSNK